MTAGGFPAVDPEALLATRLEQSSKGEVVVLPSMPPGDTVAWTERFLECGSVVDVPIASHALVKRSLVRTTDSFIRLKQPNSTGLSRAILRTRDVFAAALLLLVTSPLLAISALAVKVSSPGPVLFRTAVVGRYGAHFTWHKVRTMRVVPGGDEDERSERFVAHLQSGARVKLVDRARVTAVGRLLRRHSIDELPQLFNVLTGDMTLVGPRPCLPYEYEASEPWHKLRFQATPGLTGAWQAYGRSQASFDEMAFLDYCYAHSRSFGRDLGILLKTFVVVVTGQGGE